MKKAIQGIFLFVLAAQVLVIGQGPDAKQVLAQLRAALGGEEKLAAVKTVSIEGQSTRSLANGTSSSADFEMAFELPDKFMTYQVYANVNGNALKRRSGFNGGEGFEEMDTPPGMMGGGGMHMIRMSPGGPLPGGQLTPEQAAAARTQLLTGSRREFARLALGMFGSSFSPLPLEFRYSGQAESQDGKAHVIDVQGADGFAAKLFVDSKTNLPLMLSWMDREPVRLQIGPGDDMAEAMKRAEANRRSVEYRMIFGEYKAFGDVKLPTRVQRMMAGVPSEELSFDKIKVNQKIDGAKFKVVK